MSLTNCTLAGAALRAVQALTALVVACCLLAVSIAPSSAQDKPEPDADALEVSLDGLVWTDSIDTPLFDPEVRWVPGDVRTARFFVRNNRTDQGTLQVVVQRPERDELLDTGSLSVAARAGNGRWTEVASGGRHVLVDSTDVNGGRQMAVQLRASFDFDAPNGTMVLDSDLDLKISLTQAGVVEGDTGGTGNGNGGNGNGGGSGGSAGSGSGGATNGDGSVKGDTSGPQGAVDGTAGWLPDTGTALRPWVLPLALLLLATGAVLIARRRDDEEHLEPATTLEPTLRIRPPNP